MRIMFSGITRALSGAHLLIYGMLYNSILAADCVNFNCLARVAPCCSEMFRRAIAIDLRRSLVVSVDISGSTKDAVVCWFLCRSTLL